MDAPPQLMSMPKSIFRFWRPSDADALADRKMWFSSVRYFNDFFEMRPQLGESFARQEKEAKLMTFAFNVPPHIDWPRFNKTVKLSPVDRVELQEKHSEGLVEDYSKRFGIVCFCATIASPAVWGHYADHNQGFALEFDTAIYPLTECLEMKYRKDRPQFSTDNWEQVLSTKSLEWEYEKEFRLIIPVEYLQTGKCKPSDSFERYFLPIPDGMVRGVYFGCRSSLELIEKVREALPDVKAYRMKPHLTDYRFDPVPM
jgi:hypothetical protein